MVDFYLDLTKIIEDSLKELYPSENFSFFLEVTRNKKFGDLSLSLPLKIASLLKKIPLETAQSLKQEITRRLLINNPGISKVEVAPPGFINFLFEDKAVKGLLGQLLKNPAKFFKQDFWPNQRVLLEFVSANPTGPLSVAHGRQAVVGDVIANIFSFFGVKVVREYYVNDCGRQTELLRDSVKAKIDNMPVPDNGYHGDYIGTTASNIQISKVYIRDPSNFDVAKFALEENLANIKKDLSSLGVEFDNWVSQEKEIIKKKKVERAIKFLEAKGLIYRQEGAVWFASTKFGDDKDRVIEKSDHQLTYFASDIAYHQDKIERGFTKLINLWGPDHHGYIPRVSGAIEALGLRREALKIIIIQLVKIKQKQKMSRRQGTAILLSELVESVGKDAARFYYLTRKNSSHLDFDVDLAKARSFDNPLYYIQYAHARICSIIAKYTQSTKTKINLSKLSPEFLKEEAEISLVKELLQFRNVLEGAFTQQEPFFIIDYLKSLAGSFHKFYEAYKVLLSDDEDLTRSRLCLIGAVKEVLGLGLCLLKIEAPSKM